MKPTAPPVAQAIAVIVSILAAAALLAFALVGYWKNILVLLDPAAVMTTGEFVVRMLGVFPVPIVGTMMGWFA